MWSPAERTAAREALAEEMRSQPDAVSGRGSDLIRLLARRDGEATLRGHLEWPPAYRAATAECLAEQLARRQPLLLPDLVKLLPPPPPPWLEQAVLIALANPGLSGDDRAAFLQALPKNLVPDAGVLADAALRATFGRLPFSEMVKELRGMATTEGPPREGALAAAQLAADIFPDRLAELALIFPAVSDWQVWEGAFRQLARSDPQSLRRFLDTQGGGAWFAKNVMANPSHAQILLGEAPWVAAEICGRLSLEKAPEKLVELALEGLARSGDSAAFEEAKLKLPPEKRAAFEAQWMAQLTDVNPAEAGIYQLGLWQRGKSDEAPPAASGSNNHLSDLVDRLVTVDPAAARRLVENAPDNVAMMVNERFLKSLAREHPEEFVRLMSLPNPDLPAGAVYNAGRNLAASSPAGFDTVAAKLSGETLAVFMAGAAGLLESPADRVSAISKHLAGLADNTPGYKGAMDTIKKSLGELAESDPKTAITLARDLGTAAADAAKPVWKTWAAGDPIGMAEWLAAELPKGGLDEPIIELTNSIRSDPERAVAWARRIQDEPLRKRQLVKILRSWSGNDPGPAAQAAGELGIGPLNEDPGK